jgi:hypothetical protein
MRKLFAKPAKVNGAEAVDEKPERIKLKLLARYVDKTSAEEIGGMVKWMLALQRRRRGVGAGDEAG